jgi:hypothetical protein
LRGKIEAEQTDHQRHNAGENDAITHYNAPNLQTGALAGPLTAPCTRSGVNCGRDRKNGAPSPQFGRASVGLTYFRQQIHFFQQNCFRANFSGEKKFASLSPEFLVQTGTSPVLRTSVKIDKTSVAPRFN